MIEHLNHHELKALTVRELKSRLTLLQQGPKPDTKEACETLDNAVTATTAALEAKEMLAHMLKGQESNNKSFGNCYTHMTYEEMLAAYDYHASQQRKLAKLYFLLIEGVKPIFDDMDRRPEDRTELTRDNLEWELKDRLLPTISRVMRSVEKLPLGDGKDLKSMLKEHVEDVMIEDFQVLLAEADDH